MLVPCIPLDTLPVAVPSYDIISVTVSSLSRVSFPDWLTAITMAKTVCLAVEGKALRVSLVTSKGEANFCYVDVLPSPGENSVTLTSCITVL